MTALLDIKGLSAGYGPVVILRDIDLGVEPGSITALVGPNGAGKTTLMKTILGLIRADSGRIVYNGADISQSPSHSRVDSGIALVPEGRMIFAMLTVEQNLRLGAVVAHAHAGAAERLEEIYRQFPKLKERRRQLAGSMSGGEQQMLALSRGLACDPAVLLLDELSMGLAPLIVEQLYGQVAELARTGVAVLVVEQFATAVLDMADRAAVLVRGKVVYDGPPGRALTDELANLYLGSST